MRSTASREATSRLFGKLHGHGPRLSALALAIATAQVAYAQSTDSQAPEEIIITGSRIRLDGMETSNPVTVVTPQQLQLTSPTTMIEGMAELPQFYQSNTTTNTGGFFTTPGAGTLNLRGLQGKRTLTLLSGRRVVSSTIYGGPDINLFPESMMRTIETVTSGATATYGTDAVAGVVNFILDTNFEGIRGDVQMGQSERGDNQNSKASLSAGFQLGEKTHLLVSGETFDQDAIWSRDGYDWYQGWALLQNPSAARGLTADNPVNLPYSHVVSRQGNYDGVLTFPLTNPTRPPPAGGAVWQLDANGNASAFVLGNASDATGQSIANGGSGSDNGEVGAQLQPETSRDNVFLYLDHDFGENLTVYGQVLYGESSFTNKNTSGAFLGARAFTIFSGNPFLPADIQQKMIGTGTAASPQFPSVTLGRIGHSSDLGFDSFTQQDTETTSITGGFDLNIDADGFFNDWALNGYYQHGTTDVDAIQRGGIRLDRIYLAADAVRDTSGNIVCNVTLRSGQPCTPINLFGRGRASAAAVDFVTGFEPGVPVSVNGWLPGGGTIPYSYTSTADKARIIELEQNVFEISANGDIAKGWGAGAIAMAAGISWREEGFIQYVQAPQGNPTTDPSVRPVQANNTALGIRGVPTADATNSVEIQFSKVPFGKGDFSVKEAFTEIRIPLVADKGWAQRMDLGLAARWADYSGSGDVQSWKGGLEWAINDLVRFRGTVSQDVRAATLGERYDRTGGLANVIDYGEDPAGGTASRYDVTIVQGGNPNVRPEEGRTQTAGFVFRPGKADKWNFSVDWYDIEIKDNINQFGVQNVINNCHQQNDVDACTQIDRNGVPSTIKPGLNRISLVNDVFINVNSVEANGVDFEVSYGQPLGGGDLGVRLLGSYLDENSRTDSKGTKTLTEGGFGLPEWQFQVSGTWSKGPLFLALQARYSDDTLQNLINNTYRATLGRVQYDVPDWVNQIDSSLLLDANFGYNFELAGGNRLRFYANINNLLDEDPQANYAILGGLDGAATNGYVGDLRGRRYALGLSFDF
jgi:outer membrane receptor protein involved in Fe transport